MSNAMDEVASIAADLRAWLEWEAMLGAEVLPRERVDRTPGPPIRGRGNARSGSPPAQSRPRLGSSPRSVAVETSHPTPQPVEATPPPPPPPPREQSSPEAKPPKAGPGLSAKWAKLMEAPPTQIVSGPVGSVLMIVRGAGSSPEAETMLERMITNVLGLQRSGVTMVDLVRDGRSAQEIGGGFRGILNEYRPQHVLVMGSFAVGAIFGEAATLAEARGDWHALKWSSGEAPMRVSHHPEAILALGARGQSDPKREAFADLQAVSARLS